MPDIAVRARRAYEWGRAKRALRYAALALGPVALTFSLVGLSTWQAAIAAGLLLACWGAAFMHRAGETTALAGLTAGLVPFGVALVGTRCMDECATGDCCSISCTYMCLGAGFAAGVLVPLLIGRVPRQALALVGAGIIATAVGALGCHHIGAGGALGIAAGIGVGLIPRLVIRPASA
jgi:hypothetical protein